MYQLIDWGLTLEALPPRGGGSAECPKKDKRRVRRGSREQNHTEHTNQSEWTKARWILSLPQTSRANPVQCYSTHQEKWCKYAYSNGLNWIDASINRSDSIDACMYISVSSVQGRHQTTYMIQMKWNEMRLYPIK